MTQTGMSRARAWFPRLVLVCIGALFSACTDEPSAPEVTLADIRLPNLEGETELLVREAPSRPRIVNFWATWCGPCREEMPDLQALAEALDAAGQGGVASERIEVVGVTVDRDLNLAREFLLQYDVGFRQLSDPGMQLLNPHIKVDAYPTTLLLDAEGRVLRRSLGVRPWADPAFMADYLAPLELDQAPFESRHLPSVQAGES